MFQFTKKSAAIIIAACFSITAAGSQAASCDYVVKNDWGSGFQAAIVISNTNSTPINGWEVSWAYADGSKRTSGWNASVTGNNPYTATNLSWNGSIQPGQSVEFGIQGSNGSGDAQVPEVTGDVCDSSPSSSSSSSTGSSSSVSSSSSSVSSSSSSVSSSSSSVSSSSSSVSSSSSSVSSSSSSSSSASGEDLSCDIGNADVWNSGAVLNNIKVTNNGASMNSWSVSFPFSQAITVTNSWNASIEQSGNTVTASGNQLGAGESVNFGFQLNHTSGDSFMVPACNGGGTSSSSSSSVSSSSSSVSSSSSSVSSSSSSSSSSAAAITAAEAADEMGAGFNLGQMFDNDQHSPTYSEASKKIIAYYEQGFRTVRIPVSWTVSIGGSRLADTNGIVNRNNSRLGELERVVDYALSLEDMYVVLDAHHEAEIKDNNRASELEQLWTDITDIFKDRDKHLIFEILNEPHLSSGAAMDPANLRTMTGLAYDKIREVNPNRIIAIGGNQWFGAQELAVTWPNLDEVGGGNDEYLMATFHHYNPWEFNGMGQLQFAWTENDIADPINTAQSWANSVGQGMPVYIGEWGTNWQQYLNTMDCNNIRAWYEKLHTQYAVPAGMPTIVWDDGGWFGIWDHATDSFNNNLYQCIINGTCEYSSEDSSRFNSACDTGL